MRRPVPLSSFFSALIGLGLAVALAVSSARPTVTMAAAPTIPNLQFTASPSIVDVGSNVDFTVSARSWPSHASVSVTFLSPHHGFSGQMQWEPQCNCFRLAVYVAKRSHPIERAQAAADIKLKKGTIIVRAIFLVRGLASDGTTFSPGGTPTMTAWVGDASPVPHESQHYCVWVNTSDGIGVPGLKVTFVVYFRRGSRSYRAGVTNITGVGCVDRSIGASQPGERVRVDAYAGSMETTIYFKVTAQPVI
jgi:hypothetical protein